MSVSALMINKFNAPRITLRGSKMLWGRSFKRTYDLRIEEEAIKAAEAHQRLSFQYAMWKKGREESEANPETWPSPGAWFRENVCHGIDMHKHRNPCTFLKVTRHRR